MVSRWSRVKEEELPWWVVVRNLKDVEGVKMALPAISVSPMRNSSYKASRVMYSGVKVFLNELQKPQRALRRTDMEG
jgi:hypothetical protein